MIKIKKLLDEITESKEVNVNIIKELLNSNKVTKIESIYTKGNNLNAIDIHLENGKVIIIEGFNDDDTLWIDIK